MSDRAGDEFRRFVAARSAALLCLAFLLTADRGIAEDVLQTALVRTYLRWRTITGDPERYVRRVLVTVEVRSSPVETRRCRVSHGGGSGPGSARPECGLSPGRAGRHHPERRPRAEV
jgi:hypothetical protein